MALIASATILVIVLATDLGRKRISKMRPMVLARSAVLFTKRHRLRAAGDEFAPRAGAEELVAGGGL